MSAASAYSLLASSASTKTTRLLRCRLALLLTLIVSCYNCKSADALSVSLASNSGRFVPELYQLLLHCNVSKNPHYVFWYYSSLPGGPDRALLARCHWDTATCAIEPSFHNWTNLAVSANGTLSLARVAKSQDGYYECNAFIDQLDAKEGIRLVVICCLG